MESRLEIPVDTARLAVSVVGSGPPLFLLHGWQSSGRAWSKSLPHLTPYHRCAVWDQRGWGESTGEPESGYPQLVADVRAVVCALSLQRPLLVGHSWGAKTALACAAEGIECAGVVGVDGAVFGCQGTLHEEVYDRIRAPVLLLFAAGSAAEHADWPFTPEWAERLARRHPGVEVAWLDCGHDVPGDAPAELARRIRAFAHRIGHVAGG